MVQTAAFLALTGGSLYFCVCELQRATRSGCGGARAHPWAKNRFKLSELVYYRLDYWLSVSAGTKSAALLAASYLLIFVGGAAYSLSVGAPFSSALWSAWTFVADPGHAADVESSGGRLIAFLIAFLLTVGGMLMFALMIGIIADGVSGGLDALNQGKSRVVESGHSLILGWRCAACAPAVWYSQSWDVM